MDILSILKSANIMQQMHTLERNEYLCKAGQHATDIFYIESGTVKVFVMDEEEQIIRFGYKNDLVVPLDSFISGCPTDYYIQTIKKSGIRKISKPDFMSCLQSREDYRQAWTGILENLVLQQLEREKDILTLSAAKRYERVLKRSPKLFQEVPHRYIANYLGMSPETLSRLKKS